MSLRRFFTSATTVITALFVLVGAQAAAATSSPGDALSISPVRQDITVTPGSSDTVDVYIENLTSQSVTLQGIVNDFTASPDESGNPAILLNPTQYAPTHSLKRYVAPIGDFTLGPNQQKDVKVTITIPKGTAGGGYYGAVRFEPATSTSAKNVTLSASVGSLVLVTVPGNLKEQVSIASFDVRHNDKPHTLYFSKNNIDSVVRFQNEGNVQEEPFGKVILKKGNKVLGTYEVNNATLRGNVLPNSIRKFTVSLSNIGSFGKYTVEGNFGYGSTGQLLTAVTSFYVIPLSLIVSVIVAILLILFLIFGLPRMIRKYNQNVIRKASTRRK